MSWYRQTTGKLLSPATLIVAWLCPPALADMFGSAIAVVGDCDKDGIEDILVADPAAGGVSAPEEARIWLFSGRTGEVLCAIAAGEDDSSRNVSLVGTGDLNGDKIPDFAVGSVRKRGQGATSIVRCYSGATGSMLFARNFLDNAETPVICSVGDVNGDDCREIAVGFRMDSSRFKYGGAVHVLSGRNGTILHTVWGSGIGSGLGRAIVSLGDVDGEESHKIAIAGGPPENASSYEEVSKALGESDLSGYVLVYSLTKNSILRVLSPQRNSRYYGYALAVIQDLSGDGDDDVLVGQPFEVFGRSVFAYCPKTGELIRTWDGGESIAFGSSLLGLKDQNSDGVPDILVAAPGLPIAGSTVWLLSGQTGLTIERLSADVDEGGMGICLSSMNDIDGDGRDDFAIGSAAWGCWEACEGRVRLCADRGRAELRALHYPIRKEGDKPR